jgi:hypothetical protein
MEKEGREEDVYPYVLTCGHDLKGLETYACETSGTQALPAPPLIVSRSGLPRMTMRCNNALNWSPLYFLGSKTWMKVVCLQYQVLLLNLSDIK